MTRHCEGCTKCCEGWLDGNVRGYDFYPGKACHFCNSNIGCKDYIKREFTCHNFYCQWLIDEQLPYWMKPSISNIIIYPSNRSDIKLPYGFYAYHHLMSLINEYEPLLNLIKKKNLVLSILDRYSDKIIICDLENFKLSNNEWNYIPKNTIPIINETEKQQVDNNTK